MIVRIQTGRSFHGAAIYYLHDKRAAHELLRVSDERVAWTHTHNCASHVPELAIHEMIAIATHQAELKREAGRGPGGRTCDEPVMTISLSWHPVEKPTKDHMIETAESFLKHMGWQEHQAMFLAHNDTEHQHVHVVLNRIHPLTGIVHDNYRDQQRARKWREGYERQHGKFRDEPTPQRHMHHDFARQAREVPQQYALLEAQNIKALERFERRHLANRHEKDREAFLKGGKQQFKDACRTAYQATRAKHRPLWVQHYRQTKDSLEYARGQAQQFKRQAIRAAKHNDFDAARGFNAQADKILMTAERLVAEARFDLNQAQRTETREAQDAACKQLFEERRIAFETLKDAQKQDRGELHGIQTARTEHEPYDHARLKELLQEVPPAERQPPAQTKDVDKAPIRLPSALREDDEKITRDPAPKGPHRNATDAASGGIAKAVEIIGNVMESFIAPPTEKEQAIAKAQAQAEAEAAPEREAAQAEREAQQRAQSTAERIQAYFAEHAERIAAEAHDRALKEKRTRER